MAETNPQAVPSTSEQISKNLAALAQTPSTQTKLPDLAHQPVPPPAPPLVPNPMAIPNPAGPAIQNITPLSPARAAEIDKQLEFAFASILAYVTKIPRFDVSFMEQPHIQQLVQAFKAGIRREMVNENL